MDEQITQKYESVNKKHCILLASQADWAAHQARILKALAFLPRFKCYYRCHCFLETLSSAPFLASESKLVGVPSLIEYQQQLRRFTRQRWQIICRWLSQCYPPSLTKLPLTVKSTSLLPAHACECRWKLKLQIFLGLSQMF